MRQAGVGSAVNDSTRLLGGTLGVAVIGSVYASLYAARLTAQLPAGLPGRISAIAHQSVGAGSVAGTQLAVRAGTKLVVTAGLVAMAGFYVWVAATTSATTSYGIISVQMVVYGLGMGFTSAPATESIMGAVSMRQAGVGSAVNDSTRLLGGTLGVAVIGSVYASLYGARLTAQLPAGLPGRISAIAHQSVGAAIAVAGRATAAGHAAAGQAIHAAATNAFLHGLAVGCLVAGLVAAAGAVLAVIFLPAQPTGPGAASTADQPQPVTLAR